MPDSTPDGRYGVLVVEADADEAAAMNRILSVSFDVTVTRSAQDAIAFLQKSSVHVICASYPVPGMDSVRFLQRAMAAPGSPCMLFVSSAADLKDKKLEGLSGAVSKPCDPKTLSERVSRLCQVAETRRRVTSARTAILRHHREPSETKSRD